MWSSIIAARKELVIQNERVLTGYYDDHTEVEHKLLRCVEALAAEVEALQEQVKFLNPGWRG